MTPKAEKGSPRRKTIAKMGAADAAPIENHELAEGVATQDKKGSKKKTSSKKPAAKKPAAPAPEAPVENGKHGRWAHIEAPPYKGRYTLAVLAEQVSELGNVCLALDKTYEFKGELRSMLVELFNYADRRGKEGEHGMKRQDDLVRTINLAHKVIHNATQAFYAKIRGWREMFTTGFDEVRAVNPEIVKPYEERVEQKMDELEALIADPDTGYMRVAESWRFICDMLDSARRDARLQAKRRQQDEEDATFGKQIQAATAQFRELLGLRPQQ